MKNGDMATAKTYPVEVSKHDRTPDEVVGRLEITPVEFMDRRWNSCLVWVLDADGDEVPVEVIEDSIEPAPPGASVTVLEG